MKTSALAMPAIAPSPPAHASGTPQWSGLLWGGLGVFGFSFTLPMTRFAVAELDSTFVGLGRALIAAALAFVWLMVMRKPWPTRAQWARLALVAGGVVIGFPLLSSWALRSVPSSHGAVLVGLLPAATAVASALRGRERPSLKFWLACAAGLVAVLAFAVTREVHSLTGADALLLLAVAAAAIGYAEGGALAKEMGGPAVISWALLLAAPIIVIPVLLAAYRSGLHAGPVAWLGFLYTSCISMFVAFFAWYHGLAEGGVARVSQLQLMQPVLTLLWSAMLLGESISPANVIVALIVAACVFATWKARVRSA